MPAKRIRIFRVPKGKAPLWVRKQWIGCEFPVQENFYDCGHIPVYAREVGTGKMIKSDGFDVWQPEALWQLEKKGTEGALKALAWWKNHKEGYPRINECFRFDSACAKLIETRNHPEGSRVTVMSDMESGSFTRPM